MMFRGAMFPNIGHIITYYNIRCFMKHPVRTPVLDSPPVVREAVPAVVPSSCAVSIPGRAPRNDGSEPSASRAVTPRNDNDPSEVAATATKYASNKTIEPDIVNEPEMSTISTNATVQAVVEKIRTSCPLDTCRAPISNACASVVSCSTSLARHRSLSIRTPRCGHP